MWNDGGRTPQLNGPNRHNATLFLNKTCVRNLSSKETRQYGNASKLPVALDDDDGFLLCNQKTVKFQLGLNGILVHAEHQMRGLQDGEEHVEYSLLACDTLWGWVPGTSEEEQSITVSTKAIRCTFHFTDFTPKKSIVFKNEKVNCLLDKGRWLTRLLRSQHVTQRHDLSRHAAPHPSNILQLLPMNKPDNGRQVTLHPLMPKLV